MNITKTIYVRNKKEWRSWLKANHSKEKEIWLIYYNKDSGKPRISYNDAVNEALCFGWIDSTVKKIDKDSFAQRFSKRNPKSSWSELNKERARMLIMEGRMMPAGEKLLPEDLHNEFVIPKDILKALMADGQAYKNFQAFPDSYKRIRIGYIESSRKNKKEFRKRLSNFLKMTARNKMFGMVK